jgi:hypothetical protein
MHATLSRKTINFLSNVAVRRPEKERLNLDMSSGTIGVKGRGKVDYISGRRL